MTANNEQYDFASELAVYRARARDGTASSKLAVGRFIAEIACSDTAESWVVEASRAYEEALAAIKDHTDSKTERLEASRCYAWYASFLEGQEQYDEAERHYRKALELDPVQSHALGNYAMFMHKIRRNRDDAVRLFDLALAAYPNHSSVSLKCKP